MNILFFLSRYAAGLPQQAGKGIGILIIQLPTPCVQHNFQRAGNVSRFVFLLYHKTLPCARFSCMFCKKAGRDCE